MNEVCDILVVLLAESDPTDDEVPEEESAQRNGAEKHEGLFMKLAVLMAGVFLLSFEGVMYFVCRIHSINYPADYSALVEKIMPSYSLRKV